MAKQPVLPSSIAFDYKILKKIGEGSCGETWLLQYRIEKKPAVLKFLKSQFVGDFKAMELFDREAKLLQSVNIQGIPSFYGHFTDEEGNDYLLQDGQRLMEVKISNAMPLWFARLLSKYEIYPTSFSKYGNFYKRQLREA